MADGSGSFNFPLPQRSMLRPGEIVVDLFAGGGGASEGLKQALGVDPALAYNHDEMAIGMHAANHPLTLHHREDIWHADPRADVAGRPVGWFHASPDCTHFSQAKGGQPRSRKTRALSWVVLKWLGQLRRADRLRGTDTAPRILSMENVWQILTWGPLVAKRCKSTGRVLKMDGTAAAPGERVPVENQQLVPDKRHSGRTWRQFVAALRALGYVVEWKKLIASDYGAGTSRERLFLLGRRDGQPIVWPAATHGAGLSQLPRVTAADCLDFTIPCPSIFERKRPLADATMRRIAKGIMRHVIKSADPFIVPVTHQGGDRVHDVREPMRTITAANRGELMLAEPALAPFIAEHANASNQRTMAADEPLRTVCAGVKGGHFSVVTPILAGVGGRAGQSEPRSGDEPLYTMTTKADTALVTPVMIQAAHGEGRPGGVQRWGSGSKDPREPVGTVTASGSGGHAVACAHLTAMAQNVVGNDLRDPLPTVLAGATRFGVVSAFVEQANGGFAAENGGHSAEEPLTTITTTGSQQRLVTANMATLRNNMSGAAATEPLSTIAAQGEHHAVVECTLTKEQEAGALRVAAFLVKYYGSGIAVDLRDSLDTITTKDRIGLVTVMVKGTPYVIVDIGLRMLKPHELFRAQGFPKGYIIDRTANGTPLTTSAAVRMVGNSVSPPPMAALARANLDPVPVRRLSAA